MSRVASFFHRSLDACNLKVLKCQRRSIDAKVRKHERAHSSGSQQDNQKPKTVLGRHQELKNTRRTTPTSSFSSVSLIPPLPAAAVISVPRRYDLCYHHHRQISQAPTPKQSATDAVFAYPCAALRCPSFGRCS